MIDDSDRIAAVGVFGGPAELQDGSEPHGAPHRLVPRGRADHPQRADLPG